MSGLVIEQILLELFSRGIRGLLSGGGDASIVDQDRQGPLARRDLVDKALNVLLASDIGDQRDDLARNALAVGLRYTLKLVICTPDDVYFGSYRKDPVSIALYLGLLEVAHR